MSRQPPWLRPPPHGPDCPCLRLPTLVGRLIIVAKTAATYPSVTIPHRITVRAVASKNDDLFLEAPVMVDMPIQKVSACQGMREWPETGGGSAANTAQRGSTVATSLELARKITTNMEAMPDMSSSPNPTPAATFCKSVT